MAQQFPVSAFSYLVNSINASATSAIIQSTASFPSTGNFHVNIGGEVVLVTGIAGSTLTIVRGQDGTTARVHDSGARVVSTLTAQGLNTWCSEKIPLCGDRREFSLVHEGDLVTSDDFTWFNQNTATITDHDSGAMSMVLPGTAVLHLRGLAIGYTTSIDLIACISPALHLASVQHGVGIGFRESSTGRCTGIFTASGPTAGDATAGINQVWIPYWSNTSTLGTAPFARTNWPMGRELQWLRITHIGTTLRYYVSMDGIIWSEIDSEAQDASFSTAPNQVYFGGTTGTAGTRASGLTLQSWYAVNP